MLMLEVTHARSQEKADRELLPVHLLYTKHTLLLGWRYDSDLSEEIFQDPSSVLIIILHQVSRSLQSLSEAKLQFLFICSELIKIRFGWDQNMLRLTGQEEILIVREFLWNIHHSADHRRSEPMPPFRTVTVISKSFVSVLIKNIFKLWNIYLETHRAILNNQGWSVLVAFM